MKLKVVVVSLLMMSQAYGQIAFNVSKDKELLRGYGECKSNQLSVYDHFNAQLDSQINRLATGIDIEINAKSYRPKISAYNRLVTDLLLQKVLMQQLRLQLDKADLDAAVKQNKDVFKLESIKLDLEKELKKELHHILEEHSTLSHHFKEELIHIVVHEAVMTAGEQLYHAVGNGLLTKVITQATKVFALNALKSTLVSFASETFASAGYAVILMAVTFPVRGYRLTAEDAWLDILKKNPELLLNPEWMRYAGSKDAPWFAHCYAMLRRTDKLEKTLKILLKNTEAQFQAKIVAIEKITPPQVKKAAKPDPRMTLEADNVRVEPRKDLDVELAPFWAVKKD